MKLNLKEETMIDNPAQKFAVKERWDYIRDLYRSIQRIETLDNKTTKESNRLDMLWDMFYKEMDSMQPEDHYKSGAGCSYGQPDGDDDYINECDCLGE